MKVYKVVKSSALEASTMDGWEPDRVLTSSGYISVSCSTPVPRSSPDPYNGQSHAIAYRDELVQVHEPMFLLHKDHDVICNEVNLRGEITKGQIELSDVKKQRDQLDGLSKDLQAEKLEIIERNAKLRSNMDDETKMRRKLEHDIAKVRGAIGEIRMREILGGK